MTDKWVTPPRLRGEVEGYMTAILDLQVLSSPLLQQRASQTLPSPPSSPTCTVATSWKPFANDCKWQCIKL